MTIVAWDGKTLASDSRLTADDAAWACCKKIKKVDGWLIGAAGNWDMLTHFLAKFNPECIANNKAYAPINPAPSKGDFEALAISPKGKVYFVEDSGVFGVIQTEGFIAIGSGGIPAMVAMSCGKDAVEAVKVAIKYGRGCGGKVHTLKL